MGWRNLERGWGADVATTLIIAKPVQIKWPWGLPQQINYYIHFDVKLSAGSIDNRSLLCLAFSALARSLHPFSFIVDAVGRSLPCVPPSIVQKLLNMWWMWYRSENDSTGILQQPSCSKALDMHARSTHAVRRQTRYSLCSPKNLLLQGALFPNSRFQCALQNKSAI